MATDPASRKDAPLSIPPGRRLPPGSGRRRPATPLSLPQRWLSDAEWDAPDRKCEFQMELMEL
jgi:hypothetical protein